MQGKIIKGIAGFYYVQAENESQYECKAKGIFRKDHKKPLVGDEVTIEVLDEEEKKGSITELLPRRSELFRPAVANICLLYTSPSPRDRTRSRMPSSA